MVGARVSVGVINPASHFASAVGGGFNVSRDWPYYAGPFSSVVIVAIIYATVYSRNSPSAKADAGPLLQQRMTYRTNPRPQQYQNNNVKFK